MVASNEYGAIVLIRLDLRSRTSNFKSPLNAPLCIKFILFFSSLKFLNLINDLVN